MNQIKEKEYFSSYRDCDYPNDVILIGLNYDSKTKEHQCLIEKLGLKLQSQSEDSAPENALELRL